MDDERNDIAVGHVEPVIDHDWGERTAPDDIGPKLKRLGLSLQAFCGVEGLQVSVRDANYCQSL